VCDHAVLDVLDQRRMHARKAGRRDTQIAKAHARQRIHHHIDDVVAVSKVVMKRYGHAVFQAREFNGLFQAFDHFVFVRHPVLERRGVLVVQPRVFAGLVWVFA
jgi:hypothetical protein